MTATDEPLLYLVDGYSLAFRAYHALPPSLVDAEGNPAQVVYGFLSMLFRQIAELRPSHVAVTLDEGRPFREELFPQYKQGRQDVDPEVERQVGRVRKVLQALDIPLYLASGYEADDVLATLARQAEQEEVRVVVLSGDRDLFGIISPLVTILYPTRSMGTAEHYDAIRLRERWGIEPGQVADWKALVGDASDNIPGVRGIGEKTATRLLADYATLDGILEHVPSIGPPRVRAALEAGREQALLCRQLTNLVNDVPGTHLDLAACRLRYHREDAIAALDTLGFRTLRERLPLGES